MTDPRVGPDDATERDREVGNPAPVVLVADDDPVVRAVLRRGLARLAGEVLEAGDGEVARSLLEQREVDLVITDLLMPRLDGLGLIRWGREHRPGAEWIILSGLGTFDAAVEAVQLGAFEFLTKPVRLQELEVAARNALEQRRLRADRERLFLELEAANRELAEKVRDLEDTSEALRRDLERAEVIQRALLPKDPPRLEGWQVSAIYRPGRHVGGDLYQVLRVGDHHLVLYVADATGHGVSSAMMSVLFHRRLSVADEEGRVLPAPVALERVNRALCDAHAAPGVFLTAAYCVVDLERGDVEVAGAGHPPVLVCSSSGEIRHLLRTGPALGLVSDAHYGAEHVHLDPGDRLLLFTDGLVHAFGEGEAWPSFHRMLGARRNGHGLLDELLEHLGDGEGHGKGHERDDVTAVLLEASAGPSSFDNQATADPHRSPALVRQSALWYGEAGDRCFLEVRGRGTWAEADAFHEIASGMLEAGRTLVIALPGCRSLDSTFLGTMHELVSSAGSTDGRLELRGVPPSVRAEFEELGMEGVLAAIHDGSCPVPQEMQPLSSGPPGGRATQLRVLRAHEALAGLSTGNQGKFHKVVEAVRARMSDPS